MAAKLPALTGDRAHQLAQMVAWIDAQTHDDAAAASGLTGKITYGQEFALYAAQYPTVGVLQAYEGWLLTLVGGALPQVIGTGVAAGGADVGILATGAAQGAAKFSGDLNVSVTSFLGRLASASLWERVAQVAIGIVLIAAGVAKLTDAVPIATKIAGVLK